MMKFEWLFFFIFSCLSAHVVQGIVPCIAQKNCSDCMKIPGCSWCQSESLKFKTSIRCNDKDILEANGCPSSDITFQKNKIKTVKDDDLSNVGAMTGHAVQMRPQHLKISLRPNHPIRINVTFRQAEDYPVDLYYLMDLTANMRSHKEKLAELGDRLAASMNKITTNFRLGFGSFVDKVVMPYANMVPKKLINPCGEESACRSPYGYQNHLELEKNVTKFVEKVVAAQFSGNLDDAEGGLDAIVQAIVCKDKIKWDVRSRKIILFATGSTFHVAGDGKLGGIIKPNDGQCHMDDEGYYTETTSQDYPSIGQINEILEKHKVYLLFAVPNKQINVYQRMSDNLVGSKAAELASDSSNIVQLIANQYNEISSEVQLIDNLPSGVSKRYYSKCQGNTVVETNTCKGLKVGTTVEFDIELELKSCPSKEEWKKMVSIQPFGLADSLKIELDLQCECNCEAPSKKVEKSPSCNDGNGTRVCGICQCYESFYGKECECGGTSGDLAKNNNLCKKTNSSKICSGRGVCHCGLCECSKREGGGLISGEFCEYDNFSCLNDLNGNICGGPERGSCGLNSKCECKNGFSGSTCECGSPMMCIDQKDPMKSICHGHGSCECGKCVCYDDERGSYLGKFCQTRKQTCDLYEDCVRCKLFKDGPLTETECDNCSFVPEVHESVSVEKNGEIKCQMEDEKECIFLFIFQFDDDSGTVKLRAKRDKVCPEKVDLLYVVIGVIVGVLFIGLIIVMAIRFCMYLKDKKEYEAHLKNVANTDWTNATTNPLHVPPKVEYKNPIFGTKEPK